MTRAQLFHHIRSTFRNISIRHTDYNEIRITRSDLDPIAAESLAAYIDLGHDARSRAEAYAEAIIIAPMIANAG